MPGLWMHIIFFGRYSICYVIVSENLNISWWKTRQCRNKSSVHAILEFNGTYRLWGTCDLITFDMSEAIPWPNAECVLFHLFTSINTFQCIQICLKYEQFKITIFMRKFIFFNPQKLQTFLVLCVVSWVWIYFQCSWQ